MKHHSESPARILCTAAALLLWISVGRAGAEQPLEHGAVACDTCHMRSTDTGSTRDMELAVSDRCVNCHGFEQRADGLAAAFHSRGRRDCASCHSFHDPDELKVGETRFAHTFGDAAVGRHCVACHGGGKSLADLSEGHLAAKVLYHGGREGIAGLTPSEACLLCHSRHDADVTVLAAAPEPPRFAEHTSHPYGSLVSPGRVTGGYRIRRSIDPRIPLFDGAMECQSCHDIAAKNYDLLVRFDNKYDLCLGCHQRRGDPEAVMAAADPGPRAEPLERTFGLSD